MKLLRLALAQVNPTVGDLAGNSAMIIQQIQNAKESGARIVVFPELALTGYPPEDLVHKPQFITENIARLDQIRENVQGIAAVIGFVDRDRKNRIFNAAAVMSQKKILDVYHKIFLPNYGVFDEFRYFTPGKRFPVYALNGVKIGVNICEDMWHRNGPAKNQARAGAEVIININASPYEKTKPETREKILAEQAAENGVIIVYLNTVGGQDELVFDGMSMVYDHDGRMIARGKQFREELIIADLDIEKAQQFRKEQSTKGMKLTSLKLLSSEAIDISPPVKREKKVPRPLVLEPRMSQTQEVYEALVLGTSDYVRKNGFRGVVIGISGGIDSALVSTIAVDAVGSSHVTVLFMPSRYTSRESREDAYQLAEHLGIEIREIPIDPIYSVYLRSLREHFKEKEPDTTEENLQARIRGNILMAFSNKFGWLVLTTGNKSEMSVGYATLYGDMAGGFAVIKDVPKTLVYELSTWRNSLGNRPVIPARVLWKEPTAELKADQKDTDTLPPYQVLDPILKAYIEEEKSFEEIMNLGCEEECVKKVITMIDRSEYKRRQAPPGIKITGRAFGRDRRFPITNRFRSY